MHGDGFHQDHSAQPLPPEHAQAKRTARYVGYFGVILIPFVSFLLGLTVGYSQAKQDVVSWYGPSSGSVLGNAVSRTGPVAPKVDLALFWEVLEKLETLYIDQDKVNYADAGFGAIKGMVASLGDQYTSFMTPKETEEFHDALDGELEGIGAELALKESRIIVIAPLKGSPAERAGIRAGDSILEIDGQPAANLSLTDAVSKIRGKPGTKVVLTLIHQESEQPLHVEIVRQAIKVPSVELDMLEGNHAHVIVSHFGTETAREFDKIVTQLLIKKPKGIIVDLRNNGGGYLDAAIDLASEFIEQGTITVIRKRETDGTWNENVERADGNARLRNVPLVILINEGSASASEIFTGAMRDHSRAKLVGEKTFGKGTVQDLVNLSDGSSLRITTAKWFTPNNVNVHQIGIEPDVKVQADTDQDGKDGKAADAQLQKALEVLKTTTVPDESFVR